MCIYASRSCMHAVINGFAVLMGQTTRDLGMHISKKMWWAKQWSWVDTTMVYFLQETNFRYFCISIPIHEICTCEIFVSCNPRLAGSGHSPCCCGTTAVLHYFKPVNCHLPDPYQPAFCQYPTTHDLSSEPRCVVSGETRCQHKTRARGLYGQLTNKQQAHIGKSVHLLPQWWRSCHTGYSFPTCTQDSPPLPHSTHSGICDALWRWNCTDKSLPCRLSQHVSLQNAPFSTPRSLL